MTSSHHAPYVLGYTRTTMVGNRGKRSREAEQTPETRSQFGLQAATRLHEVGIASNRRSAYCGEYVPGLVHTARHTTKVGNTRSRWGNRKEPAV